MPKSVPVITKAAFVEVAHPGCSIHIWTEKDGEMDVTVTDAQYCAIRAQLSGTGRATIPTFGSAAA